MALDCAMIILLPVQMAYSLIGETSHKITGAILICAVIIHNVLNRLWYKNLFCGRYTLLRIFQTGLNFVLLACILALAVSGAMLTLVINTGFARLCHMLCAYWAFVLMSLHLGVHWQVIMQRTGLTRVNKIVLRVLAALLAVCGVWAFAKTGIWRYMSMQSEFVFFDFDAPLIVFFAQYIAMIALFAVCGYYISFSLRITRKQNESITD
jgi:hypothetical protein